MAYSAVLLMGTETITVGFLRFPLEYIQYKPDPHQEPDVPRLRHVILALLALATIGCTSQRELPGVG